MLYIYPSKSKISYKVYFFFILHLFFITVVLSAQELSSSTSEEICVNCFSSEIIEISQDDNCIRIDLMVYTEDSCNYALSHLMVEVPCGLVSDIYNSRNLPVEEFVSDPSTGLTGFKIDNIQNFGEKGQIDTFYISYTVCSSDSLCLDQIQEGITLAYKAGTCVFTDEIPNETETEIDVILTPYNVSCFDGSDGSVYSEVIGGEEPFSYQWSNGSTGKDLLNVKAGSYTLVLTDAFGNTVEKTAVVKQPEFPLSIAGEVMNTSCNGYNGNINVTVNGGTSPYTFMWTSGQTTEDLVDVGKGSYNLFVKDAMGCSVSKTFTVEEETDLELTLKANYLECYEEGKGEIVSTVTGGTEPYQYSWSNGETSPDISGVNSGHYSLQVTDSGGCTKLKSAYIGIKDLSISASIESPDCYGGNNGQISILNVIYGTPPFNYLWSTGDTTSSITGLTSGLYEVTVTDLNGCSVTKKLRVSDPQELNINYSVKPRDCSENSEAEILLSGSGGSGPYQFYLGDSLVETTVIVPGNGEYTFSMTDSKGCETSRTIHIESSENINIISSIVQPSCTGIKTGYASFTANGGTDPYMWEWPDGSSGSSKTGLTPGDYTVNVIDGNGCLASTNFTVDSINEVTVNIQDPVQPLCNSDNNILYATSTNATRYSWNISSSDGSWTITPSNMNELIYHAGNDKALFIYHAWNEEGCEDSDSLVLACTTGSSGDSPTDTTDNTSDDNEDGYLEGDCQSLCWETEITKIEPLDFNCYQIELLAQVTGFCEHDLSHLVVGLENAYISNLSNSGNFKVESNFTDPLSGEYGFKIDEIHNFRDGGITEFTISFEVCFSQQVGENYLPEMIPVIYKAATCSYRQELNTTDGTTQEDVSIVASAYPNPFTEELKINLNSSEDTKVNITIFDLRSNKVAQLYEGGLKANVKYTFTFNPGNTTNDKIFIYKIVSPHHVLRGQILRQK